MKRTTILIVDDYEPWRSIVRSQLEAKSFFHVVAEASNGCEAIEKAAQLHPDVVLLDIAMPLLNGLDAAPRIRRASPDSKIIFLTQEQDHDIRTAALATGAEGYLPKSGAAGELASAIQAALGSTQPILPDLSPSLAFV
jgi:DNA-binding NarL/FixJ family response regulator